MKWIIAVLIIIIGLKVYIYQLDIERAERLNNIAELQQMVDDVNDLNTMFQIDMVILQEVAKKYHLEWVENEGVE